jgi:hypothetical protein
MDTIAPVGVEQYVHYREQGYLIVRGLVAEDEVGELLEHVDELVAQASRPPAHPHAPPPPRDPRALHAPSRILDVVAALIGPDVLALQTMLFVKGPRQPRPGLPPGLLSTSSPSPTR